MMSAPRLEIDLSKIQYNARSLVDRLGEVGISVTGVTKAALGSPDIAKAMLMGGVKDIGDSRISNIELLDQSRVRADFSLIRSPMLSQVDRVVASADVSFNSELDVIRKLSLAAKRSDRMHAVVLMVELGDLREGIMPADLMPVVLEVLNLPNIKLKGIGTNLACRSGVSPDDTNMGLLSRLATSIENAADISLEIVSGGNSANLDWVFGNGRLGRINNLRLGESILLGREALNRNAVTGLYTDAISLVAEVIESKVKPSQSSGKIAESAFGKRTERRRRGANVQTIFAIGIQDIDPCGLQPPKGMEVIGCSSDHLITTSTVPHMPVGTEVSFQVDYSALIRAMTSPFVTKSMSPQLIAPNLRQIA